MKEIVFVTTNKGKIASAQKDLKTIRVLPYEAELIEPRGHDVREIAKQKVLQAYGLVQRPCIALDSGFYIRALNGFPRAYVNDMLETIGIGGVLKLLHGETDRFCEFRTCVAYYDGAELACFESGSPGTIAETIRGEHNPKQWSELWHIFIPQGFEMTLAEFTESDFAAYDRVRGEHGLAQFGRWYDGN